MTIRFMLVVLCSFKASLGLLTAQTIEDSTSIIEVIGLQHRSVEQFQQH